MGEKDLGLIRDTVSYQPLLKSFGNAPSSTLENKTWDTLGFLVMFQRLSGASGHQSKQLGALFRVLGSLVERGHRKLDSGISEVPWISNSLCLGLHLVLLLANPKFIPGL